MNTLIELKEEIRRSLLEDYNGQDEHENEIAQGVCARLLYLIDAEPSKKLEEEIADYISYLCEADIKENPFEQIAMCARHFANWQKEQDESQKRAKENVIHKNYDAEQCSRRQWNDKEKKWERAFDACCICSFMCPQRAKDFADMGKKEYFDEATGMHYWK